MDDLLDQLLNSDDNTTRTYDVENEILDPLLEEIDLIQDQGVVGWVRSVLFSAPHTFWIMPSTDTKAHPPDEHTEGGLVLHTKRVVRIVNLIADAQHRTEEERNILTAAALIHDVTRGITNPHGGVVYDPMHPYTVDGFVQLVREHDDKYSNEMNSTTLYLDEEVQARILRLIRTHKGTWSIIPETVPSTGLEWTLHLADMLATKLDYVVDGAEAPVDWRWEEPKGE